MPIQDTSIVTTPTFIISGFGINLIYSQNFLIFSDKEAKIKYLEKVIDCIAFAIGEPLGAKPSRIVSGQEPQKTNEFLQALAQVIDKKIGKSRI